MSRDYFAAIDIGTNAGRVLIGYVIPQNNHLSIKKALLTRVPLRLGEDVFKEGYITDFKRDRFVHAMKAFDHLMQAYQVKDYRAVATSAMREAKNGEKIRKHIKELTGIELEIIDGDQEANYIFSTFHIQNIDHSRSYLFIDVGGGSSELTIIKNGQRIKSKSFKIGALRVLKGKVKPDVWNDIEKWLKKHCINNDDEFSGIGTGGNINRIVKMNKKKYLDPLMIEELEETLTYVNTFSYEQRIEALRMKPDRADVIIPAGEIYHKIMKLAGISEIYVPKMGVVDGIIMDLYTKSIKRK